MSCGCAAEDKIIVRRNSIGIVRMLSLKKEWGPSSNSLSAYMKSGIIFDFRRFWEGADRLQEPSGTVYPCAQVAWDFRDAGEASSPAREVVLSRQTQ